MRAELYAKNLAQAEPAMRRAAAHLGAQLLPIMPQSLGDPEVCTSTVLPMLEGAISEANCESWSSDDGRAFRFLDSNAIPLTAITVRADAWTYARLARLGNKLFVLEPKVTRRKVGEATQCRCGGTQWPGLWPVANERFGFVIDGPLTPSVQHLEVPVAEDVVLWACESRAL